MTRALIEDLVGLDRPALLSLHRYMLLARTLDKAELRLKRQQKTFFQVSGAGHEAVQAAVAMLLKPAHDWFYPYYRDRTLCLALGVSPLETVLQSMGKAADPSSGGREMPCHYGSPELHIVNQSSPTGTQYLQAVGTAEAGRLAAFQAGQASTSRISGALKATGALRERVVENAGSAPSFRRDEIVYVSGGEGSTSQGEFYEAVSAACLAKLPVLFLIQDNRFAISVPVEAQTPGASISALFRGYPNLFVNEVDGLDVIESYRGLRRAVAHLREGKGPALVHAHVVRLEPHSDSDNDEAYRPAAAKAADIARDPIPRYEEMLVQEGYLTPEGLKEVYEDVRREVEQAVADGLRHDDPDPSTAPRYVVNSPVVDPTETPAREDGEPIALLTAIQRTLEVEMERNPQVVVFGEDVADHSFPECLDEVAGKGGVFKVTHNLQRRFGERRVFNSPIAEAAIVGRAFGLAVRGFLPVVEIQFQDYIWPAMHQIRNELSMMRWRSNNEFSVPAVIRVATGGYLTGGGPYHSQSAESIFCHCPGLRVVMPSNARDAAGLLRTAMYCGDPVLFLEHKHLYRQVYARSPDPGPDYRIPLGKARVARPGRDLTLVTYGALVEKSLRAAQVLAEDGVEVEVIDLRSLAPYDWDAIRSSVERTNRLVVAYEDNRTHGFGAEIAARAAEELFSFLDAPVGRVGGLDAPVSYSPVLERAALPSTEQIVVALRDVRAF